MKFFYKTIKGRFYTANLIGSVGVGILGTQIFNGWAGLGLALLIFGWFAGVTEYNVRD
jgi:hypothetical protein